MNSADLAFCPVQGECGGCPSLVFPREREHDQKRRLVSDCFAQAGVEVAVDDLRMVATSRYAYRNRLRYQIHRGKLAFFNRHKIPACVVLSPGLKRAAAELDELLSGIATDSVKHLEVRDADDDGLPAAYFTLHDVEEGAALVGALRLRTERFLFATSGCRVVPEQRFNLPGDVFVRVPINAFRQVHSATNRALITEVVARAKSEPTDGVLDLFSGAGNFSLALAKQLGTEVIAVENHTSAMNALDRTSREQELSVRCLAGDVFDHLAQLAPADLVVFNPPRGGLKLPSRTPHQRAELVRIARKRIFLCCCDPASTARDVAELVRLGFAVESVQLFDMFPNTKHVEVLVVLRRTP